MIWTNHQIKRATLNGKGNSSAGKTPMKLRMSLLGMMAALMVAALSTAVRADPILRITEIWAGQDASDLTVDWFELTNVGNMAWVAATGPVLTVNDNGGALTTDDVVEGLADILPGESAIILMEGTATDKQTFFNVWNPVKPEVVLANIGYADGVPSGGLGLSSTGDGVRVWLNDGLQDSKDYNNPPSGRSWDVRLGGYSTVNNPADARATILLNDAGEAAIASPGTVPVVPEPASIVLSALGAIGAAWRSRQR